ncbi:MAG: efflux RND transporter periplasmic adaptor subunit [Planctomycetota bacterium]
MLRTLGLDAVGVLRRRVGLAITAVVGVALLVGGAIGARAWMTPKPTIYETAPIERGDLRLIATATGTLQPVNQVEVGSDLSGRVSKVHVTWNQSVTINQALAELDTALLTARVNEATAQLALANAARHTADATVAEATANLARLEPLKAQGITTDYDIDAANAVLARAKASRETSDAQIASAEAALAVATTNLENAVIRSPINGVVLDRNIEPGQSVVSSLQAAVLFRLAEDLTRMELYLDVDEADIGRVREGQSATFSVAAWPERVFHATVGSVRNAPATTNNVVTYVAVLDVDNKDLALRPGMTATAAITIDVIRDVLLVPNAALRFEPATTATINRASNTANAARTGAVSSTNAARVWVLRDGELVSIPVRIGATADGRTQLTGNELAAGTEVITGVQAPRRASAK